jgi:uncharacterized HAD superfamily protein
MLRIGLDLDGVVANWDGRIRQLMVDNFGYSPKLMYIGEDYPDWYYIQKVVKKEHWEWIWKTWAKNGGFAALDPMPEAPELVEGLKKYGELCITTSRPRSAWFDTLYWLDKHNVGPPKEVHFYENGMNKVDADCDIYIEDAPHYANNMVQNGYPVLIPARRYNNVPAYPDILGLRFDTAKDILNYMEINYARKD